MEPQQTNGQESVETLDELDVLDWREAEVVAWRHEELVRAGYSPDFAIPLAEDHHVDLHLACDLLKRGCPERTAYLILA